MIQFDWEDDPIWRAYFFRWVAQPPTSKIFTNLPKEAILTPQLTKCAGIHLRPVIHVVAFESEVKTSCRNGLCNSEQLDWRLRIGVSWWWMGMMMMMMMLTSSTSCTSNRNVSPYAYDHDDMFGHVFLAILSSIVSPFENCKTSGSRPRRSTRLGEETLGEDGRTQWEIGCQHDATRGAKQNTLGCHLGFF